MRGTCGAHPCWLRRASALRFLVARQPPQDRDELVAAEADRVQVCVERGEAIALEVDRGATEVAAGAGRVASSHSADAADAWLQGP